ncbi:ninjurin-2 isoform X4 [Nilaparvata lugens]|uniref:ninjurin-2 isoform X4 n=1 Tax=Nilaparvata lugens TaxID=108931 RepID=UPI00193D3D4D|nr:ninjurin-2 isoform X4 [Nilaparvata lugens]
MVSRLRRILGNMSSISPEEKPLDANRYATKKTIAQGMLDIALLTANASQLKYILQVGHKHEFYTLMLGLITTSIILQVLLGIASLISSRININLQENKTKAAWWHHIAVCCITLGVIVDVIKMTFSVDSNFTPDKIVV